MTNLLETASQWLSGQLDDNASSDVEYRRGSLSVSVVAGKGRTSFDAVDSSGVVTNVESRDFIITAETIVLDGIVVLPRVGDWIVEQNGDELHAYEVIRFGTEQHYRACDPYGHKLRIPRNTLG